MTHTMNKLFNLYGFQNTATLQLLFLSLSLAL